MERLSLALTPRTECTTARLADTAGLDAGGILGGAACNPPWKTDGAALSALPIPVAAWGVNPGDRRALYCLVHALKPRRVLEIGTHIGASTAYTALALARVTQGRAEAPHFVTVDVVDVNDTSARPWEAFGAPLSPRDLVQSLGVEFVQFVHGDSLTYFHASIDEFDLIFLDGSHSAKTVYREVAAASVRLRPGGWILLHDYYPRLRHLCPGDTVVPGPYLALRRLQRQCSELTVLPLGNLPWPTKGGATATSLALVGRKALS
jgi:predicted O-methyltransferase YrrM